MRLFSLLLCFIISYGGSIGMASAKDSYGRDFGSAFAEVFNELMTGLRDRKCIGEVHSSRLDLTFSGILPGNIHMSKSQRDDINSTSQEAIRKTYGGNYNISYSQEINTSATLNYTSSEELTKIVQHHMKNAPLFLLMRTRRPFRDIVQLDVIIYGRSKGTSLCNRQKTVYLHLPSFTLISKHNTYWKKRGIEGDYIHSSKGYFFGIRNMAGSFKGLEGLSVQFAFANKSSAAWHKKELKLFRDKYFEIQKNISAGNYASHNEWPGVRYLRDKHGSDGDEIPSGKGDILLVHWGKPDITHRVVQFTMSFAKNGYDRGTKSYFIVSDTPRYFKSVQELEEDRIREKKARIAARKAREKANILRKKRAEKARKQKAAEKARALAAAAQAEKERKEKERLATLEAQRLAEEKRRIQKANDLAARHLDLEIITSKKNYRLGEQLSFKVSTSVDCELNVVYKQSDGKLIVLPYYHRGRPLVGNKKLKAGEIRHIPGDPEIRLSIKGPVGTEYLFVQCKEGGLGIARVNEEFINVLENNKAVKSRGIEIELQKKASLSVDQKRYAAESVTFLIAR